MLPKPAIACLAAIAFEATTALVARPWSVAKVPTPGIWDWPHFGDDRLALVRYAVRACVGP